MARYFQIDWVSKYPFIELVENPNKGDPPIECRCKIYSWKYKKDKRLQLKLDTISIYYFSMLLSENLKVSDHFFEVL